MNCGAPYLKLAIAGMLVLVLGACESIAPQYMHREPAPKRKLPPGQYEVFGEVYQILDSSLGYVEIGVASWYGKKFHGRLTANGETYDMFAMTAAHKSLPLTTMVRITNLDNGRKITLRVNDRGPFHDNRLIDLSYSAARALGFADKGTAPVVVEALDAQNYPDRVPPAPIGAPEIAGAIYYLQAGAFSQRSSADGLQARLQGVLGQGSEGTDVRVLESELEAGSLHKVWVGPIAGQESRIQVAGLLRTVGIEPIEVKVE